MADHVEQRGGGYYLTGSRVALDSVVYPFRDGASAEVIRGDFPTLTLEQIQGAIAFYLAHRNDVDAYLSEGEKLGDEGRKHQPPLPDDLRERLLRARQEGC